MFLRHLLAAPPSSEPASVSRQDSSRANPSDDRWLQPGSLQRAHSPPSQSYVHHPNPNIIRFLEWTVKESPRPRLSGFQDGVGRNSDDMLEDEVESQVDS